LIRGSASEGPRVITPLSAHLRALGALIAEHRDLLEARALDGPPPSLAARGWDGFLAALDDETVARLEIEGHASWPSSTPPSLRALVDAVQALTELPELARETAPTRRPQRGESPRKRAQVDALVSMIAPLARRSGRAIELGAGHGYLARAVAGALGVPVLGLERDEARVRRARAWAREEADEGDRDEVTFAPLELRGAEVPDARGALLLGLHACGALGDALIEAAAAHGAAVALVGCCLQKRPEAARVTRNADEVPEGARALPTAILGLSNAIARDQGVEASRAENLAARERRVALRALLAARGIDEPAGREMAGLNRRAAHGTLESLVTRALALRGLHAPSPGEIDAAAIEAQTSFAQARRMSLPRALLARPLELFVAIDRARVLERAGHTVTIGRAFDEEASARNVAILAEPG
jgi:hypothetical protein